MKQWCCHLAIIAWYFCWTWLKFMEEACPPPAVNFLPMSFSWHHVVISCGRLWTYAHNWLPTFFLFLGFDKICYCSYFSLHFNGCIQMINIIRCDLSIQQRANQVGTIGERQSTRPSLIERAVGSIEQFSQWELAMWAVILHKESDCAHLIKTPLE